MKNKKSLLRKYRESDVTPPAVMEGCKPGVVGLEKKGK
jgi:hypothetical protein